MSKTTSERPASGRAHTVNPAGKKNVEALMLEKGVISAEQLEKAKNIQAQTLERLEDIIVRLGFLSEKEILDLWAAFLDTSVVDLTNIKVDAKILSLIPEYQAKQYKVIPYKREGNKLTIVMADPFDIMASDMIAFLTQCKLEVLIAPKSQIDLAIKQLYSWEGFSVTGEETLLTRMDDQTPRDPGTELARRTSEEGPVVQFLNAIFKQAILKRASDIHIEPREDILLVRFRIDGLLHDAMTGPKSLMAPLVSRVKILSHLDIAERRMPQDGRLKVKMEGKEVDFRVSTVPSLLGEKAVLRLLQRESAYDLDNIGFLPDDLERLKSALDEPYGMVLLTGPTGAGKTTTLFGMLKYFNSSQINIFTIENPVEYRMDGITQVQINEKIGLDFPQGLRAALRQDPDVILVGEIRDLETAEIAFRASLTGHKVLSTLHTNNAAATINRLINMGVPAYLVTAALRAVIAQKLLHRICPKCRTEYRPSQKTFQKLKLPPSKTMSTKFFRGTGCRDCNMTGAYGRLGVFETMVITSAIRDLIMEGGTEMLIKRGSRLGGMKTMREIALQKCFDGLTTLEEVLYSTPSDDEPIYSGIAAGPGSGRSIIMPIAMPVAAPVAGIAHQDISTQAHTEAFDANDPLMRQALDKLEEEFLFFTDEELMARLQVPLGQLQEMALSVGVERTADFFRKRFGKLPEEMSEDDLINLIRNVQEKQGRMPEFLFESDASAQALAKAMTSEAVRLLSERVSEPQKLPQYFTEDFCRECGLDLALDWAHGSRLKLIDLVLPGQYRPWQFGETEAWLATGDIGQKVREALDWLMTTRLGCSRGDLPNMLTSDVVKEVGLGALLEKFGGSVYRLVQAAYPGIFMPWQFPEEESLIWFREDRNEIAQAAVRWLVDTQLKITPDQIPARIGLKDFHGAGLSKLLDLFNQNLFQVVDNAFPERFKPWEFAEQGDLWRNTNALETARKAVSWLIQERLQWEPTAAISQLTRRHFLQHGLGFMLGTLFNHSPLYALENAFEALKTNEIFQKTLIAFSQEVRDLSSKWASLAEKIALNQFGKARFKVALPNLKVAPILPENERIYYNASNQIEYVPQIIVTKLSAYDDYADFANWVPYCDRLIYWVLFDDRTEPYLGPAHPKVKLMFSENLVSGLRNRGMLDVVEKIHTLRGSFERLLDRKAPAIGG